MVSSMDLPDRLQSSEDNRWQPLPSKYGITLTKAKARSWALVLDSRSIPCCIETLGSDWQLLVPEQQYESAIRELQLYEEANFNWPPALPAARRLFENTLPTISVLILLATFHNLTLLGISIPERGIIDLRELGSAHASQIMGGKWWQCVTALTLHADLTHLLSNLTIGGVFVLILCRELGSGLSWSLLLASGSLGNFINAAIQSPDHRSLGASTAVFGAVGLLAAISTVRYRHHLQKRWFVPVAAGLALLAILGTEGKNSDLGAHLFGFGSGIFFGICAEYLVGKYGRPGGVLNFLLAAMSTSFVLVTWLIAIEFGG